MKGTLKAFNLKTIRDPHTLVFEVPLSELADKSLLELGMAGDVEVELGFCKRIIAPVFPAACYGAEPDVEMESQSVVPVQFPDAKDLFDTLLPGARLWFDDTDTGDRGIICVVALAMGDTIEVVIEETGEPCIYSREDINAFCSYRLPEEEAEAQGGPAAASTDEVEDACADCDVCKGTTCQVFMARNEALKTDPDTDCQADCSTCDNPDCQTRRAPLPFFNHKYVDENGDPIKEPDQNPQEQPQEAAIGVSGAAGDAGEVAGSELPAIDDIIVRNKRSDDETACFLRVVSHSGETFRAVNLHDASGVSPISLGAYKQFYRHATDAEIADLFEQGLLAINAPAPQAASEPLPAVAYLDPAGMPVFVHTGINDRETGPFGAFRLKLNGSLSRVVSKNLPMQETRDAAQADLDAWALPSMKPCPMPEGYGPPESIKPGANLVFETVKHKRAPTCYIVTDSSAETGESTLEPVGGGEAITITRGNHTEYELVKVLKQI